MSNIIEVPTLNVAESNNAVMTASDELPEIDLLEEFDFDEIDFANTVIDNFELLII